MHPTDTHANPSEQTDPEGYLTTVQVAAILRLRPVTIRYHATRGVFGQRLWGRWVFSATEIERYRRAFRARGNTHLAAHRQRDGLGRFAAGPTLPRAETSDPLPGIQAADDAGRGSAAFAAAGRIGRRR